jgi:hypothetical protein
MSSSKLSLIALALSAGLLGGASCGAGGNARMTVLLTDAPGDFKAAVVTIEEIHLQGANGTTVLSSTRTTTDLLTLAHDTSTLVADAVIEPGTYTELDFVISGGYVEVDDGNGGSLIYASSPDYAGLPPNAVVAGTLKMPSFAQSGLKVDMPAAALVVGTESKVILVDFNVEQSFGHVAGNSGSWVMHPVVKGADVTLSGNLDVTVTLGAGVVLPVVGGVAVTLDELTVTATAGDGTAHSAPLVASGATTAGVTFLYLPPGSFQLTLAGPAGVTLATSPSLPLTATVTSGEETSVAITVTAATSP